MGQVHAIFYQVKNHVLWAWFFGLYLRTTDRTGYRNGYKSRILKTHVGRIELSVPQDRAGR